MRKAKINLKLVRNLLNVGHIDLPDENQKAVVELEKLNNFRELFEYGENMLEQ